jgi:uncharacterized lipoprotein YehR (DUF1307 family)
MWIMKKFAVIASVLFICVSLTGCEDKTSVDWYVKHHEEMIAKYSECLIARSWQDTTCQNARSAMNLEADKPDVKKGLAEARKRILQGGKS